MIYKACKIIILSITEHTSELAAVSDIAAVSELAPVSELAVGSIQVIDCSLRSVVGIKNLGTRAVALEALFCSTTIHLREQSITYI